MPFSTQFLYQPERLATDGRSWGREHFTLPLAGRNFGFKGLSLPQQSALDRIHGWRPRFAPELTGQPAIETKILRADPSAFRALEEIEWDPVIELDPQPGVLHAVSYRWLARIEWGDTVQGTLWTAISEGEAFTNLFENYSRLLVAYELLARGGLLVHSAAVADATGAWLFPGASGHGKSTLSRLALEEGHTVLSDDSNALFPDASRVHLAALPFGGEFLHRRQPTESFSTLGVAALKKGPEHQIESLTRVEAVALLMTCAPFVNGDPYCRETLFANAESLVRALSAYRLTFAKRGGFWTILSQTQPLTRDVSPIVAPSCETRILA